MKNSRNSYNNTAANRKKRLFRKKAYGGFLRRCASCRLWRSATAVATGSVPCRAANREQLHRLNAAQSFKAQSFKRKQSRQQRSELRAVLPRKNAWRSPPPRRRKTLPAAYRLRPRRTPLRGEQLSQSATVFTMPLPQCAILIMTDNNLCRG